MDGRISREKYTQILQAMLRASLHPERVRKYERWLIETGELESSVLPAEAA